MPVLAAETLPVGGCQGGFAHAALGIDEGQRATVRREPLANFGDFPLAPDEARGDCCAGGGELAGDFFIAVDISNMHIPSC